MKWLKSSNQLNQIKNQPSILMNKPLKPLEAKRVLLLITQTMELILTISLIVITSVVIIITLKIYKVSSCLTLS